MSEMKTCTICKVKKPATKEFFGMKKRCSDGLNYVCKICKAEVDKAYYNSHFEERRERNNEHNRGYYAENKEAKAEYSKRYRAINYDKVTARESLYYEANHDKIVTKAVIYRKANPDKFSARLTTWRHANPEKRRLQDQRRRSRINHLAYTLTLEQWENINIHFNNACAYCGKESRLTQDHFMPLIKSGEYSVSNIIPACKSCNSSKGVNTFSDWYPKQPFYTKDREVKILKHLGYKNQKQQLNIF